MVPTRRGNRKRVSGHARAGWRCLSRARKYLNRVESATTPARSANAHPQCNLLRSDLRLSRCLAALQVVEHRKPLRDNGAVSADGNND